MSRFKIPLNLEFKFCKTTFVRPFILIFVFLVVSKMPSKSKKNKASNKSSENQQRADEMRKSILRDPELPLRDVQPQSSYDLQPSTSSNAPSTSQGRSSENQENDQPGSSMYHLPKMNTGHALRQKLKEVSQYRAAEQSMSELTIGTKQAVNKEVENLLLSFSFADAFAFQISSKLNVKLHHKIFKDLIPLEDKPKKLPKRVELIEKSKVVIKPKKQDGLKAEISTLVGKLMDLDYENAYKELENPTPISTEAEIAYLGLSKFVTPHYNLSKKDAITKKYSEQVVLETERIYEDVDLLDDPDWALLYEPKDPKIENLCSCLKNYSDYSQCD